MIETVILNSSMWFQIFCHFYAKYVLHLISQHKKNDTRITGYASFINCTGKNILLYLLCTNNFPARTMLCEMSHAHAERYCSSTTINLNLLFKDNTRLTKHARNNVGVWRAGGCLFQEHRAAHFRRPFICVAYSVGDISREFEFPNTFKSYSMKLKTVFMSYSLTLC